MEENEVELIDYLRVLWRWKWLIVTGTVVSLATAFLLAPQSPASYKAAVMFDLGPPGAEVSEELRRFLTMFPRASEYAAAATVETPVPGALKIAVSATSEADARVRIEAIAADAENSLNRIAEADRVRIAAFTRRRDQVATQLAALRKIQADSVRRGGDMAALAALLAVDTTSRLEAQLGGLEAQLVARIEPRLVRGSIEVIRSRASRRLLVTVAGLGGFVVFVTLAFLLDYALAPRRRRQEAHRALIKRARTG